jgi:phenylacetate-CoA ligase
MKQFAPREYLALLREYVSDSRHISTFLQRTADEISAIQFLKAHELIELAYNNTTFYRRLYCRYDIHPADITSWSDFESLPTVDKNDILANYQDCIIRPHAPDKRLRVTRSSGSSGQVLNIVTDTEFWIKTALLTLRMFQHSFHLSPLSRGALIYTSPYPFQSAKFFFRPHHLSTLTPAEHLIRKLTDLKPHYITAYPSILLDLADSFPERCSELKPKAISTNSEQSSQQQRDAIRDVFGCPVFDEYSTEEMSLGGFQCEYQNYHLQEDCAYFEILDPLANRPTQGGQLGEIVGTCLINNVMPFIRYRQGDLGSITTSECSCGSNGRILSDINGRKNSSFKLNDGRVIPSGKILDWIYALILDLDLAITNIEIAQMTPEIVKISIATSKPRDDAGLGRLFSERFRDQFDVSLAIEVAQVSNIIKSATGKHIPIKSYVTLGDNISGIRDLS